MNTKRQQLTLFLSEKNKRIEELRKKYNPIQFDLIPAHVTLCREDEIENLSNVIDNIQYLNLKESLKIQFNSPKRFAEGKGVLLPSRGNNDQFNELRSFILNGAVSTVRNHQAHITLMHPRNSSCTDEIFKHIDSCEFPREICFTKIELIEQINGGPWQSINSYNLIQK